MIDIETILTRTVDYLKANLNTKIGEINTEKNDGITLATVADSAIFLQTLNDALANYDPYMLVAISDIASEGNGPGVVKTLTIDVILILGDQSGDLVIANRLLRYGRILEELMSKGFAKILPSSTFIVNSLVPIAITSVNTNDPFRAVGVQIVTALG